MKRIVCITAIVAFACLLIVFYAANVTYASDDSDNSDSFVFVNGGCYDMGDEFEDGESDEKPVHEVCVDDFYIGKYEVTVGGFKEFVTETGYKTEAETGGGLHFWNAKKKNIEKDNSKDWRKPGFLQTDKHPVVGVSWNDVLAYIRWINHRTGHKYRLPREAEWEYAARNGGKKHQYSWGNGNPSGNIADETLKRSHSGFTIWEGYDDGRVYTSPVGRYRVNEIGLYDMTGNVWEWCSDWYSKHYYKNSPRNNPKGASSGPYRVYRGGSWGVDLRFVRASNRFCGTPDYRFYRLGFRLARTP